MISAISGNVASSKKRKKQKAEFQGAHDKHHRSIISKTEQRKHQIYNCHVKPGPRSPQLPRCCHAFRRNCPSHRPRSLQRRRQDTNINNNPQRTILPPAPLVYPRILQSPHSIQSIARIVKSPDTHLTALATHTSRRLALRIDSIKISRLAQWLSEDTTV